jgi:DNA-binding ferritin-like protein (Dps family)
VRFSFDGMHEELLPALPTLEKNECMKPMLNSEIMCTTIERDTKEEWNTSHRRSSTVTNEFQMSFKECSPYTIIENDTTTNIPLSKPFITQALHFPQDAHMFQQKYTLCCLPPIYLGLLRLILDHLSSQPYDETYMNTITQKFLTCTASLFSSFLQIPGLSQYV